ncbi:MAG: signal peptide peptidase SppA, partial [Campylobacterales bacterium]
MGFLDRFKRQKREVSMDEVLETELKVYKTKLWGARLVLLFTLVGVGVGIFLLLGILGRISSPSPVELPLLHRPYIGVLNINQVITIDYTNRIIGRLEQLSRDPNCKGFLILFNTPGGSPAGSEELATYLKELAHRKRVVGYVESLAASGGYYIASAIKPLNANRNSVVGSIGVIMPRLVIKKLAEKIGVQPDDLYVGKYKDAGNWFRKLTKEERKYLRENLLNPTYKNFLEVVAKNRGLKMEVVKKYSDGKLFLASKVVKILVDRLTTLTELKRELRKIYGPEIKFYQIEVAQPRRL